MASSANFELINTLPKELQNSTPPKGLEFKRSHESMLDLVPDKSEVTSEEAKEDLEFCFSSPSQEPTVSRESTPKKVEVKPKVPEKKEAEKPEECTRADCCHGPTRNRILVLVLLVKVLALAACWLLNDAREFDPVVLDSGVTITEIVPDEPEEDTVADIKKRLETLSRLILKDEEFTSRPARDDTPMPMLPPPVPNATEPASPEDLTPLQIMAVASQYVPYLLIPLL